MSRDKFSRRQFLARAAAGAGAVAGAGALAGAGCSSASMQAEQHSHAAPAAAAQAGSANESFVFFTTLQGHTVDAIAERMIPADAQGPGAREAGAVFYIDRALVGPYAGLRETYRAGLAGVDAYSETTYGTPFLKLTADQQDTVLRAMDDGKATGFTAPTAIRVRARRTEPARPGRSPRAIGDSACS